MAEEKGVLREAWDFWTNPRRVIGEFREFFVRDEPRGMRAVVEKPEKRIPEPKE